jgi:hypothetical protein
LVEAFRFHPQPGVTGVYFSGSLRLIPPETSLPNSLVVVSGGINVGRDKTQPARSNHLRRTRPEEQHSLSYFKPSACFFLSLSLARARVDMKLDLCVCQLSVMDRSTHGPFESVVRVGARGSIDRFHAMRSRRSFLSRARPRGTR